MPNPRAEIASDQGRPVSDVPKSPGSVIDRLLREAQADRQSRSPAGAGFDNNLW